MAYRGCLLLAMPPLQDLDTALEENPSFVPFSEGDARRTVPNTVPKWPVYLKTVAVQRSYMQISTKFGSRTVSGGAGFLLPKGRHKKGPACLCGALNRGRPDSVVGLSSHRHPVVSAVVADGSDRC